MSGHPLPVRRRFPGCVGKRMPTRLPDAPCRTTDRTDNSAFPWLWPVTPLAVFEPCLRELPGSYQSPVLHARDVLLKRRSLPSTGITRLHRYYEPLRLPGRTGLALAGVRLKGTRPSPPGSPVLRRSPYADMPSPLPRWNRRWDRVAPRKPTTAAFPIPLLGRLPHWTFRGLESVHT